MNVSESQVGYQQKQSEKTKYVLVISILLILGISTIILEPLIFPNPYGEIALDMDLSFISNSTDGLFSADYNWKGSEIEKDDYSTHIKWDDNYPDSSISSSGSITDIFREYESAIYIQWNEFIFSGDKSWTFTINFYIFGVRVSFELVGNSVHTTNRTIGLIDDSLSPFIEEFLHEQGVDGLLFVLSITFRAESMFWQEAAALANNIQSSYFDIFVSLEDQNIGIIPVSE
jgi:hypothetical protein